MPHVLVNDLCLYHGGAGVSVYLHNVLAHWPSDRALEPRGFCTHSVLHRKGWPQPPGGKGGMTLRRLSGVRPRRVHRRLPYWARRAILGAYGAAFAAARRLGRSACYFEPNQLPIACRGPTVVAMHDLSVLDHPEWHPAHRVRWWEARAKAAAASADRWIVPSRFTSRRLAAVLGVPADRISIVPYAARPLPFPALELRAQAARELGLPERFFLHVGTIEPRKNIAVLLDALALLPPHLRHDCPLVLAGSMGWGTPQQHQRLTQHPMAEHTLVTGYAGVGELATLLAAAAAVLVPSLYEGFGLTVPEAMACGAPVICSAADALVEVAGGAADHVEAHDAEAWAKAMMRAVQDEAWRQQAGEAGLRRARQFDWAATAAAHADIIARAAGV